MWWPLYFGLLSAVTSKTSCAIVNTSQGAVQGKESVGLNNVSFVSYMGIPYAKQPIGELRFQAPQHPDPWDGVLDGTIERAPCLRLEDLFGGLQQPRVPENEACLYLNVHVPSTKTARKAVFFFIHGGGFTCGSGDTDVFGPEYIVSKDVILVTFNYRLGLFGFLCLDIPEAPGNLAGRDMVAALRWVHRNIAAFGGDPDNITVGGHSAGAASAQFLAISPLSSGLVKRVIMMGGGGIYDWAIDKQKKSAAITLEFAKKLNITETDPKEVLNQLKLFDAQEITEHGKHFIVEKGFSTFRFVLEEQFDGVEPFLAEDPQQAIARQDSNNVEYMAGFNNREGIFIAHFVLGRGLLDYYEKNPQVWIPSGILSSLEPAQIDVVGKEVKKFFMKGGPVTGENVEKLIDYLSSYYFYYGTVLTARLRSSVSKAPVYVYQFSYGGDYAVFKSALKMKRFEGVCHGDELGYIFKVNSSPEVLAPESDDAATRDRTLALWTNFIKYGNPTPESNNLLPVKWVPTTGHNVRYYNIAKTCTTEQNPDHDAVQFWDELYQKYAPKNYIA